MGRNSPCQQPEAALLPTERHRRPPAVAVCFLLVAALAAAPVVALPTTPTASESGAALYSAACAACHGTEGRGAPAGRLAFEEEVPDFTDCRFASREPDADWIAVAHQGGPVRAFARMMPAFGEALTTAELERIIDHVRTFCTDGRWPRGELNLPRPLVTEKAYPEDEAVFSTTVATEGPGEVVNEIVYEKRFGPRDQLEVVVPFGWLETNATGSRAEDGWNGGFADVAIGWKRALHHSLEKGRIFSATAEVVLPTGDEEAGLGSGEVVFEPFLTFGKIFATDAFLHLQAGGEIPFDDEAPDEAFVRAALGRSFTEGRWGRTWSPMVEVLSKRELTSGESVDWDAVPQLQVTLNRRQHVMINLGVRIPLDERDERQTQVLLYLLWDWFDGGFFDGW
ncbi:MAG: transporter [Thermoanaerobaculia bacterium]|nr:transporter [Thermoanaerobaculia bacterium]